MPKRQQKILLLTGPELIEALMRVEGPVAWRAENGHVYCGSDRQPILLTPAQAIPIIKGDNHQYVGQINAARNRVFYIRPTSVLKEQPLKAPEEQRDFIPFINSLSALRGRPPKAASVEAATAPMPKVLPERLSKKLRKRLHRFLRYGTIGSHTKKEWQAIVSKYGNRCCCCGIEGPKTALGHLTKDHIIAIADGGSDYAENLQPLCGPCNSRKNARSVDYRDVWLKTELV